MNKEIVSISYPPSRKATFDIGILSRKKHHITALAEADITSLVELIEIKKSEGKDVSLTACIVKYLGLSMKKNPLVHGMRARGNKIISFKKINISLPVERIVNGQPVPLVLLIKNVEIKSVYDITTDIRKAQKQEIASEKDYILNSQKSYYAMKFYYMMPQCIRLFIWKLLLKNPRAIHDQMGNAIVTSIGNISSFKGHVIPTTIHTLALALSPWHKTDKNRIVLPFTAIVDHDVCDGAPAARFLDDFIKSLENPII